MSSAKICAATSILATGFLLSNGSFAAETLDITHFVEANRDPAGSFVLERDRTKCSLSPDGKGICTGKSNAWRFDLPIESGDVLEKIYFASKDLLFLAYVVADDEASSAALAAFKTQGRTPVWHNKIRALSIDSPVIVRESIIVGGAFHVSATSTVDGARIWSHDWVYDRSGRTSPQLRMIGGQRVKLVLSNPAIGAPGSAVCFDVESGAVAGSCRK